MSQQSYTLNTTSTFTQSSAYLGITKPQAVPVVNALDTSAQKDLYVSNGLYAPSSVPAGHFADARIPRFGRKVASSAYGPPPMIHNPLGALVPVTNTDSGSVASNFSTILSRGHATSTNQASNAPSSFLAQDPIEFFYYALSVIAATNAGGAAAGKAFLDSFVKGGITTWGPTTNASQALPNPPLAPDAGGSLAIGGGSWIYDQNALLGSASTGPDGGAVVGATSGALNTIILQNGNFNVASIANGGTGYVIVFATGNITFSNMHPTGTPPNVILISCGGDIISTAGAHPAFLATDWAIAATPGYIQVAGINSGSASYASSSPGFASPPTAVGGYLYYNGSASTSTYTIGSHDTSGLAGSICLVPSMNQYQVYQYADSYPWSVNKLMDTPATTSPPTTFHTIGGFSGSLNRYNMVASTALLVTPGSSSFLDILTNTFIRICVQFGVIPGLSSSSNVIDTSSTSTNLVLQAGCWYISTILGNTVDYETAVSFQTSAGQVPNFGVSVEYHDEDHEYITPDGTSATGWLQTYRAGDLVYAPIKAAAGFAQYMTLNLGGLFAPSVSDYVFQTAPYYIETTLIPNDCTVSLSLGTTATAIATSGGADPYTSITSTAIQSTYRNLSTTAVTAPSSGTNVYMSVAASNFVDYVPVNGTVTSVVSASSQFAVSNVDSGKIRIVNGGKATVGIVTLTCTPTPVSGVTMQPYANAAGIYPGIAGVENVTYVDSVGARFNIFNSASGTTNDYYILAGTSQTIGSFVYSYAVSGTTATLTKVTGGVVSSVGASPWTLLATAPSAVTVNLILTMGDTIMNNVRFFANNQTIENAPASYLNRTPFELDSYGDSASVVPIPGQPFYLGTVSGGDSTALSQAGVNPVPGQPGWYVTTWNTPNPNFIDEAAGIVIWGERDVIYTAGQTQAPISLANGTYINRAGNSVTVANGLVNIADLPIDIGFVSYNPVESQALAGLTFIIGAGQTYTSFPEASAALQLDTLDRISYTGVTLTAPIVNGKKQDTVSGSGSVLYRGNNGQSINIILP